MENIWIVANWKSNKTIAEALDWISIVGPKLEKREDLKVVVCPTFSALSEVKKAVIVGNFPLIVGSQDISPFTEGAYTGEESASILNELISLSIIGHSERRANFFENDEMIAKKVDQASQNKIIPLLCIQDSEVTLPATCNLVAYEPTFAIGTGNPDTPLRANEVAFKIKGKYGSGLEVLYGGSVSSENCKDFISEENISGLLIGKASLNAEEFLKIISKCLK